MPWVIFCTWVEPLSEPIPHSIPYQRITSPTRDLRTVSFPREASLRQLALQFGHHVEPDLQLFSWTPFFLPYCHKQITNTVSISWVFVDICYFTYCQLICFSECLQYNSLFSAFQHLSKPPCMTYCEEPRLLPDWSLSSPLLGKTSPCAFYLCQTWTDSWHCLNVWSPVVLFANVRPFFQTQPSPLPLLSLKEPQLSKPDCVPTKPQSSSHSRMSTQLGRVPSL